MQNSQITLESRVKALVNDDLFTTFWDAADFFKTEDLVLFYDTNKDEDPITAYVRDKFLSSSNVPVSLKDKFAKPAMETIVDVKSGETAFWLLAAFSEGELASAAINVDQIKHDAE